MLVSVNFDGVKVSVELNPSSTVADAVNKALATVFTPEALPDIAECKITLNSKEIELDLALDSLEELREGHMLSVVLPF